MRQQVLFAVKKEWSDKIFSQRDLQRVREIADVIEAPVPETVDAQFLLDHIASADIVVSSWDTQPFEQEILDAAPNLRFVAHAAGTVKPVVTDLFWDKGIRITSAANAIAYGVSEFCLGLILMAPKRVFWAAQTTREGKWQDGMKVFHGPQEIYQQKIGIIGASNVGRHLIQLLQSFTCDVLLYDPYCTPEKAAELGAQKVESLEELFSQCMVVSLNAPSTDGTCGMITGKLLASMPEGALFINTARGAIVREDEMIEELKKGRIIACIDVTEPEPPAEDSPLRSLPNVILSPHEAGVVNQNMLRVGTFAIDSVVAYIEGKQPRFEVTQDQLATIG